MGQKALDEFGRILMIQVRDEAIEQWDKMLDGSLKGESAARIYPKVQAVSDDCRELIRELIPDVIDTAIHHLL